MRKRIRQTERKRKREMINIPTHMKVGKENIFDLINIKVQTLDENFFA